jgi:hypothetical protein
MVAISKANSQNLAMYTLHRLISQNFWLLVTHLFIQEFKYSLLPACMLFPLLEAYEVVLTLTSVSASSPAYQESLCRTPYVSERPVQGISISRTSSVNLTTMVIMYPKSIFPTRLNFTYSATLSISYSPGSEET